MSAAQTPPPDDQRGFSTVAGNTKPLVSRKVLAGGVLVVAGGVMGFIAWKSTNPPDVPLQEKLPSSLGDTVPYSPPKMLVAASAPLHVDPPPPVHADPAPAGLVMPARDPVARMTGFTTPAPLMPKPYMLSFADPPKSPGTDVGKQGAGQDGQDHPSSIVYASSSLEGIKAGLTGDQTFFLMPGLINCYLDTAVDSTFPGPVECHIPADIKPHGVTLLDRGSVIHGTYSNNVQTGQARLVIAAEWVDDKTTGCFVKFDNASIADSIGQAGVAGNVDPHNWERFSAAMLLTGGQAGESLAQAALSKGGNTYLNFNSGGGVESIASAILRKQIDIPPTITLHQGTPIAVFLTKPLDFSPCYDIKIRNR